MKGTRKGKGPPSADLLVCFPTRAHLSLMPKPICSPARHSDSSKRHHNHHHIHELKKISTRGGGVIGQASPLLWTKSKSTDIISEPTSPKVTCAGQIKVRPKPGTSCKNWQSVMEEIEKLHNRKKQKKKFGGNWMEAIGFKKDVMQFLTCLRNIKFEFRCFGSFPSAGVVTSDEDDDDDDEELEDEDHMHDNHHLTLNDDNEETSRTAFSKWFMVLQDQNQNAGISKAEKDNFSDDDAPCAPPPNALLLMRCRSAPAKSWLEERQQQQQEEEEDEEEEDDEEEMVKAKSDIAEKKEQSAMELETENKSKKENLVMMRYGSDFYKFSTDIAKETWVVGGVKDQLARSRSWKR